MPILPLDPHPRRRVPALDSRVSYVDTGAGRPVVFLHGNPTSSYLWRNIIAEVKGAARCLAPDLVGMGRSGRAQSGTYRFVDHARYLDAWFDAVGLSEEGHPGWARLGVGSSFPLGQSKPRSAIWGIVYMEAIVQSLTWEQWPDAATRIFQGFRSDSGEEMILHNNIFVERVLPGSIIRDLSEHEMAVYREPFEEPGESRRPTLTWPREIPLDGQPPDVRRNRRRLLGVGVQVRHTEALYQRRTRRHLDRDSARLLPDVAEPD